MGGYLGAIWTAGEAVRRMHEGFLLFFRAAPAQRILGTAVLLALAVIASAPVAGPAGAAELRGYDIIVANGLTEERIRLLLEARQDGSEADGRMAADLAARLGVGEEALAAFLDILAGRREFDGALVLGFGQIAARHAALLDRLAAPGQVTDPAVSAPVAKARAEVERGGYGRADELLARAEEEARKAAGNADGLSLSAAARRAERGELSLLGLDRLGAAGHFRAAADMVPRDAGLVRADYLSRHAGALATYGEDESDAHALVQAVNALHAALGEISREEAPLRWARAKSDRGYALSVLGKAYDDLAILEEAIQAHRTALEEQTRLGASSDQTVTRNALGYALRALGARREGTEELEEAVAVYETALKGLSRERMPMDWVRVMNDMGGALAVLGERKEDPALMRQAIEAFRAVMEEHTRERVPLSWAMTQHNLGSALSALAMIVRSPALIEQAVDAYRAALEEQTRARRPFAWAKTQNALASLLYGLGRMKKDPALLEEAAATFRAAMEVRTREIYPLDWATAQNSLGDILSRLAEEERGTARLEQAVEAYRSALEVFETEQADQYAAKVAGNLDRAQAALRKRSADPGLTSLK
jgi:Tetratricopeptide repeat